MRVTLGAARLIARFRTVLSTLVTPLDRYIEVAAFRAIILVAGALTALFSLLIVVALWVANRGVQDLSAAGTGLTSLGRLTGQNT